MHRPTSEVCCCRSGGRSARCAELQLYATPVEQRHIHMILAAQDSRRSRSCTPAPQPQGPVGRHVQRRRWHQALMSSDEIGVILCEVWTELVFIPNLCFAAFFVGTMRFGCKMRFTKLKCISGNPDEAPPGQASLGRVLPRGVVFISPYKPARAALCTRLPHVRSCALDMWHVLRCLCVLKLA